jgi:hypothetical protein
MQVVTDEATLLTLGINCNDSKEQKIRESLVTQNLRGKKEQTIIKNIRHISNEIAGICSTVRFCMHALLKDRWLSLVSVASRARSQFVCPLLPLIIISRCRFHKSLCLR